MPNGRKIYEIEYFLVEKKHPTICVQCGKQIPTKTELYAKGSKNSRLTICRECVMSLSDQYHHEVHGRLPFPGETPLYVGFVGHFCKDRGEKMVPNTAIFRRKTRAAIAPVFFCPECERYYIGTAEYEKHCYILSEYRLYHTLSGKPFPRNDDTVSSSPTKPEKPEFPSSVVWSYSHPMQGGDCSGK